MKALTKKNPEKTLVVIAGPTAVGKTELSIVLAEKLGTQILSADARQFYREMSVGTAKPSHEELARVKHHLIGHRSIFDHYNVSQFEQDALSILETIFEHADTAIVTGGSGMYIDTLCHGIDAMPDVEPEVRKHVNQVYLNEGIVSLRVWLKHVDPAYYARVDLANPMRMMRGIEVVLQTGRSLLDFQTNIKQGRPFGIKKIVLDRPRPELFARIDFRVRKMIEEGLIEEALRLFRYRSLNPLHTVGYRELFAWLSNEVSLHAAIVNIQTNTRRYAKRQLTWFRRYDDARWFEPSQEQEMLEFITGKTL